MLTGGIGIWFQLQQLRSQQATLEQTQRIDSATLALRMDDELAQPKYQRAINAIEGAYVIHDEYWKIVQDDGGIVKPTDLYGYIGQLDSIGLLVHDGLLDKSTAYNEFSYHIEKAFCNRDIKSYLGLSDTSSTISDPYGMFVDIGKQFVQGDGGCVAIDKE